MPKKDHIITPKSEPAAVATKEELSDQDDGDRNSDDLHEELQRAMDEFPPHDSEDSLGPEHVVDELRRRVADFPPAAGSASQRDPRRGHSPGSNLGKQWSICTSEIKKTPWSISVPRSIHVSYNYLDGA